jgi:cytochrome oxidase Cu insertion factor (SCO1/SenC/PrrC family)
VRRPSSRQRRFVILALAALAFGLAYYSGMQTPSRTTDAAIQGIRIDPPTPAPTLDLTDQKGAPFTQNDLRGQWSLLLLDPGESPAPSPALIHLMQIHNRLADRPQLQGSIHFIYLPRWKAAALSQEIDRLGTHLTGLRGKPEVVDEIFHQFGVDTSGAIGLFFLIGPDQRLHALFTQGEDAATIAQDLASLIDVTP